MADGSTYIQYGNVRIHRVVTHDFHQEQVRDDSGTDMLCSKYTIRVSGFLHGHTNWQYFTQIPYSNDGATSAHKQVRYQLPPRQSFKMVVGADSDGVPSSNLAGVPQVLLEANPAPAMTPGSANLYNIDLHNGPVCTSFVVTHVTRNELFAVDATFEIWKLECNPDGTCPYNTYGVLSNRWSIRDNLDVNVRSTRTYEGVLTLASANLNATMLRPLVAPPLQPLYRRERMDFYITTDGLKLHWTVTDQEIAVSAPYPARKWSYEHSVGTNGAMVGSSSINLSLEGDSSCNKADLITLALYIIAVKMFGKTPIQLNAADAKYIVDEIRLTDHAGDVNMITASARVRMQSDSVNGVFLPAQIPSLGKPLGPSDLPGPNDGSGGGLGGSIIRDNLGNVVGYSNVGGGLTYDRALSWGAYAGQVPEVEGPARTAGIFACFLQSPCDNSHSIVLSSSQSLSQNAPASTITGPRTPYTTTVVPAIQATQNPLYSTSQLAATYQWWQVENIYCRRAMKVQMPIARTPSNSYQSTSSFVTLAGGQAARIIRVHAERAGDWPEFPDPESLPAWPYPATVPIGYVPITQTYLKHKIRVGTPYYTATGQPIYRATMEIMVGLSRPPTASEKLAIGKDKWTNKTEVTTSSTLTNSSW